MGSSVSPSWLAATVRSLLSRIEVLEQALPSQKRELCLDILVLPSDSLDKYFFDASLKLDALAPEFTPTMSDDPEFAAVLRHLFYEESANTANDDKTYDNNDHLPQMFDSDDEPTIDNSAALDSAPQQDAASKHQ